MSQSSAAAAARKRGPVHWAGPTGPRPTQGVSAFEPSGEKLGRRSSRKARHPRMWRKWPWHAFREGGRGAGFNSGAAGGGWPSHAKAASQSRRRTRSDGPENRLIVRPAGFFFPDRGGLVLGLGRYLTVTRQGPSAGSRPGQNRKTVRMGSFRCYRRGRRGGIVYGFPDFEGPRSVKAAQHGSRVPSSAPTHVGIHRRDHELEPVRADTGRN